MMRRWRKKRRAKKASITIAISISAHSVYPIIKTDKLMIKGFREPRTII